MEEDNLGFDIDDSINETRIEVPKVETKKKEKYNNEISSIDKDMTISCLRNERIKVQHINKPDGMVSNPKHALFGKMAETATRVFSVPILSNGAYKNILTDDEKAFLEEYMGLEYNALSVYKKENNYWDCNNPAATVSLGKFDTYLDLSDPSDYIKYKILLANKDIIAPSLEAYEDYPKATYQFVIISEGEETKSKQAKFSAKNECLMELGRYKNDVDTLRTIIETIDGRPTSPTSDATFLLMKADELITSNSKTFLKIITDPMLSTKVLIKKSIEAGLIGKKGDGYYLMDGTPLCEINENPTLNIAAKFLNAPKHQEVKLSLEAKLKQ